MERDIELSAVHRRPGDPKTEVPRATLHLDATTLDIETEYGRTSIDLDDWPAVKAQIDMMLATRESFLKGEDL